MNLAKTVKTVTALVIVQEEAPLEIDKMSMSIETTHLTKFK